MNSIKNVYFPKSLKEAVALLKKKNSVFMDSGLYSFKNINNGIENIISAKYMPKYIKKDSKNLIISSNSTFDDMENNKFCQSLFDGIISKAAYNCSSQLIRNMATIGGNIAHPNAFNIMPVIAALFDSKIEIYNFKGKAIIGWKDLYSGKYKPGKDCIISNIIFPLNYNKQNFYFEKIAKLKSSWESYLTVAFRCDIKDKKIRDIRLVFGAIRAIPYVNYEFEKSIIGQEIDEKLIENIAKEYKNNILSFAPNSKINIYRAQVAENLIFSYFNSKIS